MYVYERDEYTLLMSYNPCDVFDYFGVQEMHGLSKADCNEHVNNTEQAYIAGWCNYIPKDEYLQADPKFIFINLSRCTDDIHTMGLVMHECMHMSFFLHKDEEELISWAESEAYEITTIIKYLNELK
jgi:hypothetical protein